MKIIKNKTDYLYNGEYKYAMLIDNTIVKPVMWSTTILICDEERFGPKEILDCINENVEKQEIYFEYRFWDRLKQKRKTAFVDMRDIFAFSNNLRELKKLKKSNRIY